VANNKVPYDSSPTSDYDMKGYWRDIASKGTNATQVSNFDNKPHYPDTYKTPYHKSFSKESRYANPDAPSWVGNDVSGWKLLDKNGNVVVDESTPLKGKAAQKMPAPPTYTPPPIGYRGPPISNVPIDRMKLASDGLQNLGIGAMDHGVVEMASVAEALNPMMWLQRQITGEKPIREQYNKVADQLHIPPETEQNKLMRQIGGFAGAAVLTPAFGGGMVGSLGQRMASGALEGGALSTITEAGKQIRDQKYDPLMAALAPLVGGVAGAGSGALMSAGSALLNKLAPELAKRSEAAALKAEEKAWQEYEKAAGQAPNAQTPETPIPPQSPVSPSGGLGSYEEQVRRGLIDVEDQSVHKILTGGISNDPIPEPPPNMPTTRWAPPTTVGTVRHQLTRDAQGNEIKGYDRAQTGTPLENVADEILNAEEKQKIDLLAKLQLFQKVAERHRDAFAQALHDNGILELKTDGMKYTLKPRDPEQRLSREGQKELDRVKFDKADTLLDPKGSPVRVQVDQAAIDQPFHYEILNGRAHQIEYRPPTGDKNKDAIRLKHLVETAKFYKKLQDKARKEATPIIEAAHKRVRYKDPHDNFAVNIQVGPHRILVEHQNQRQEKAFYQALWDDLAKKNKWTGDELKAKNI
jgi:hypothetical protein